MDSIMFSPYGIGPLPPSAVAEMERKMAAMRTANFQRMLDLEQKHKMERLQSAPATPRSSPPPVELQEDRSSLQVRRADSASQHQNYLMLKAVRRSVVLPPLSITIPQQQDEVRRGSSREAETEKRSGKVSEDEVEARATAEPLHKQVKFIAPDEEEDAEMSDQSSICQSPSWEGYGQRKKEKKKEAERRRKEKEQAGKEAKAAKKRYAARLSKSPPPATPRDTSRIGGLTNMDRSMSDPMLISQHLVPEGQHNNYANDVDRAASADDLQQFRQYQPAVAEVLSDSHADARQFVGDAGLERGRDGTLNPHITVRGQQSPSFPPHLSYDNGVNQRQNPHSPPPDGSVPMGYPSAQSLTAKQESRFPREVFPPSASRTPLLRHSTAPTYGRSNSLLQGASRIFKGRDGKNNGDTEGPLPVDRSQELLAVPLVTDRGRSRDGHVKYQREQSVERSVAEIAYEQLVNNGTLPTSSTRSSSRHTQNTRRSSFTQEAKSVAMKLAGLRVTSAAKEDSAGMNRNNGQHDYFNFLEHSQYGPGLDPSLQRNQEIGRYALADERLLMSTRPFHVHDERPTTAQSLVSSSNSSTTGSTPGSQGKKGRSLRDAAKAALNISRGPMPPPSASKLPPELPPYAVLRGRTNPQASASAAMDMVIASPEPVLVVSATETPDTATSRGELTSQPSSNGVKATEVETQVGSRVSEGSSSSSAYEDGSPLPSPVTTPDTSRPQSSKDVPFIVGEATSGTAGSLLNKDDQGTLRQSLEGSSGSSTSSTPRLSKSESHESTGMVDEDRWSRTALPLEIDCDAQSFTTSLSNLDNIDGVQSNTQEGSHSSDTSCRQPGLSKSLSDTALRSRSSINALSNFVVPIEPPPRSKKRTQVAGGSLASPQEKLQPQQQVLNGTEARQLGDTYYVEVAEKKSEKRERTMKRQHQKQAKAADTEEAAHNWNGQVVANSRTSALASRSTTPDAGSALFSATFSPSADYISDPYYGDFSEAAEAPINATHAPGPNDMPASSTGVHTSVRTLSPVSQPALRVPGSPRMFSAATPPSRPSTETSTLYPAMPLPPPVAATRPATATPVSILKQPARSASDPSQSLSSSTSRPQVLSALPKHMQLQAGISTRPPAAVAEARMTPIAKMFVECCNCKFYHDMPSKLYECMAKPDAVVEDRMLGISGAITTMVKCPWCQHNMSTSCCAGYAAVVYLKEKLH
ncbi:hypothetical protein B0H67DRAFT_548962 [Lasiosphaeris hirsuta]|uniref:Uncharacterized protein n=1 Tax=Lasiosphaeris hirsuta TaxID=260670 RepID=A0AA40BBD8_9PEZI|nr:hypothetical protein B0H67DRAFT_548962 [Lasiosphaeris hirsuta]